MSRLIPIYSISKPFTATAVLAAGFDLAAPIANYVPGLTPVYEGRTVGQLLNHTSGLDDYGRLPEYHAAVAAGENAWSRAELLERCEQLPHANPGFQYSNIGYLLLRMALENHTGLSYFQSLCALIPALSSPEFGPTVEEWEFPTDAVPGYDPKWVYSGTFLAQPQTCSALFSGLISHRSKLVPLSQGIAPVPYEGTGFDHPGYGYGLMNDGGYNHHPLQFVGHGGGGPGFGLMILTNVKTGESALRYSTEDNWDQSAAIRELREKLA